VLEGLTGKIKYNDINKRKLNNIIPASIGIKNGENGFFKFILRDKQLPQEKTFKFTTTKKNQRNARIEVFLFRSILNLYILSSQVKHYIT